MKKAYRSIGLAVLAVGLVSALPVMAGNTPRPESVVEAIKANKELSKFAEMMNQAGASEEFSKKEARVTIFAPNNAALGKLPADIAKKIKGDKAAMKTFVDYHAITGSVVFAGNIKGRRASPSTAAGEMLGFDGTGKELLVGESAKIVTPDIGTMNGVVHVVDAALIPPSFLPKKEEENRPLPEPVMDKAPVVRAPAEAPKTEPAAPTAAAPAEAKVSAPAPAPAETKTPAPEKKKGLFDKLLGR